MREEWVWRVGLVDVSTLALGSAIGNLILLALTHVYTRTTVDQHPGLGVWQIARCLSGVAFLLIWLRPVAPLWLSHGVAITLLLGAWIMEFRAYQILLGIQIRWRGFGTFIALFLCLRLAVNLAGLSQNLLLTINSLMTGGCLAILGVTLIRHGSQNLLIRIMGGSLVVGAALHVIRIMPLIWPNHPFIPAFATFHLILWIAGFFLVFINGFGFLLLIKQEDDEKLRRALSDVTLAEAEQRQLLSLVSHEFRTPAAMIKGSLDSMNFLSAEISPAVAARHANIYQATQRLIHLANSLITQDRLRDLRFERVLNATDLVQLVDSVAGQYPTRLAWHSPSEPLTVLIDPDLIRIALHNLIDNALRHSDDAHPPAISLLQCDDLLEIQVRDWGSGVADKDKEKLFERFYRKDAGPGSGLGLSIVRQIARLHQGEVMIRDAIPQGACFIIQLPAGARNP